MSEPICNHKEYDKNCQYCNEIEETKGTISSGEYHPAADSALKYLNNLGFVKLMMYQESFSSCAIEGNRLAEICSETLDRVMNQDKIGDRYLLGLAWTIKNMEDKSTD